MSEAWRGVQLAKVRSCWLRDVTGKLVQVRKIISAAGREYTIHSDTDGAVVISADRTTWEFIAPAGRFDPAALGALTVGGFLDAVIGECEARPVTSWEEFAAYADGNRDMINMLIGASSVTVVTNNYSFPGEATQFYGCESFADLLRWIRSIAASASGLMEKPASELSYPGHGRWFRIRLATDLQGGMVVEIRFEL